MGHNIDRCIMETKLNSDFKQILLWPRPLSWLVIMVHDLKVRGTQIKPMLRTFLVAFLSFLFHFQSFQSSFCCLLTTYHLHVTNNDLSQTLFVSAVA